MTNQQKAKYSNLIKQKAYDLGFLFCGISEASFLETEAPKLEEFLNKKHHGTMSYMENHFDKRLDPRLLVDGAKSVISLAYNYYTTQNFNTNEPKIAKYAYGEDYHHVIKEKLNLLLSFINTEIGEISGRVFVDSAPILEKAWALKSGLGFIGKNTNIIHQKKGSFFFLAEIIIDLPLTYDQHQENRCGTCTKCIDACPTKALSPYQLNASKCISYYTIEHKQEFESLAKNTFKDWIFGCDICQDVCPWNKFSIVHQESLFYPKKELLDLKKQDWIDLTEEYFNILFKNSAVKRTKFKGLKRNIDFLYFKN